MIEQARERWIVRLERIFLVALGVWIIAAAILGVPHGPGHSIESMSPVQTVYGVMLPIWIGSLVGMIGLLAVKAFSGIRPAATE